ncbi:hypothetical protein BGZ83_008276 [Gryganskiella cystojenkinii]|nr:hypothetical protein BGZ83_008276 [Gryganskiella cystojenkinii]
MTKRNSPTPASVDVDMSDSAAKKAKVGQTEVVEAGFEHYPQDRYTITNDYIKNSRFDILYMATRARAETIRLMFEFCGVNYTSSAPVEWPKYKKDTPFGLLPVLTHYKPDGTTFVLPEVASIQRYTAKMLGLAGSNPEEEAIIDSVNQVALEDILNTFLMDVWMKKDPSKEDIAKAFEKLLPYFDGLERTLVSNGSNGYLVGNKACYAEFPWYDWLHMFYDTYAENMKTICSEEIRPATHKMFMRLDGNPRIQTYIKAGRWEHRPSKPVVGLYSAGVCVSDWDRAYKFYKDTLDLECLANRQPEGLPEGGRYMEFVAGHGDKTRFTVFCYGSSCPADPPQKTGINFLVRDINEAHERLVKKGVVFKMAPQKFPWGSVAQFTDPDGNTLNLCDSPKFW